MFVAVVCVFCVFVRVFACVSLGIIASSVFVFVCFVYVIFFAFVVVCVCCMFKVWLFVSMCFVVAVRCVSQYRVVSV